MTLKQGNETLTISEREEMFIINSVAYATSIGITFIKPDDSSDSKPSDIYKYGNPINGKYFQEMSWLRYMSLQVKGGFESRECRSLRKSLKLKLGIYCEQKKYTPPKSFFGLCISVSTLYGNYANEFNNMKIQNIIK